MDKWKGMFQGPEARERNGKKEHRTQEVSKGLVGHGRILVFILKQEGCFSRMT